MRHDVGVDYGDLVEDGEEAAVATVRLGGALLPVCHGDLGLHLWQQQRDGVLWVF